MIKNYIKEYVRGLYYHIMKISTLSIFFHIFYKYKDKKNRNIGFTSLITKIPTSITANIWE